VESSGARKRKAQKENQERKAAGAVAK